MPLMRVSRVKELLSPVNASFNKRGDSQVITPAPAKASLHEKSGVV
jgi:hypothetical protein